MRYGLKVDSIAIARCSLQNISANDRVGVWVNGYEQTRNRRAQDVLEEFSVGSVVAMEIFRGGTETPAEFMSMRYCGVISVWTRRCEKCSRLVTPSTAARENFTGK